MKLAWFPMKNIAFRSSKYFFKILSQNVLVSINQIGFVSKNWTIGQGCKVNMAKRKLALLLSSFAFPIFSHRLSPNFSICNVQCILFLLLCSLPCSLPFWQLAHVESLEGEGDYSTFLWFLRLSNSAAVSSSLLYLSHGLPPAVLCRICPTLGKANRARKSSQTARSPG